VRGRGRSGTGGKPSESAIPTPIAPRLLRWYDAHGRKSLPWQHPRSAYRVWISEIMLQQTQVATVIPYFLRFVEKYTTLQHLAAAPLDDVLALWSGLGYYSRARNLHRAARICVERHGGELPREFEALAALPGIGRSTAGAILAQAHEMRVAILDGNVKRVLARWRGIDGWPGTGAVAAQLWRIAEEQTPHARIADYTQAIMDLGATLCTRSRPRCGECPLAGDCIAHASQLATALPARKPARALPTRQTFMLVLRDAHERILLERRPPTGVWASLWSFPEAADEDSAARALVRWRNATSRVPVLQPMAPFAHVFSHYRLDVTPLTARLPQPRAVADNDSERWLTIEQALQLGLPSPVRKLIAALERND
jgi:A/G-specific adenine glycosylase